ncbi:SCO7613 C-terminal domain-containing membrane protein [Glycomyces halotolerans]
MTTYNCPRCGQRSTPAQCPACGRGPEPLLMRLDELDAALGVLSHGSRSRAAVEAERLEVLDGLARLAQTYHDQSTPPAGAPPATRNPATPAAGPRPAFTPAPAPQTPPRGEVAPKTVQTLLLSLGGLLVATAIIIFTAVAWRNLGDGGRLAILAAFTGMLLAVPVALLRFGLKATAETFGALAALALWCSALAGYYLLLPSGASLTAEAVGTWTMLVLTALTAYRAAVASTAPGWAMPPLAAVGSAFAATGAIVNSALIMTGTAVVLAAASWVAAHRPSHYPRSDRWVSRLLLCGGVILAFMAGLRATFELDQAVLPPVAAGVMLLATGNLLAAVYARRAGATVNTVLVASSATAALTIAAWVLAARSEDPALAIPALALLGALITALAAGFSSRTGVPSLTAAVLAGIASLAAFAIVAAGAPELASYLGAAVAIGLVSRAAAEPLRTSGRYAAYIAGAGVAAAGALIALSALPSVWWELPRGPLLTWEVPAVLVVLAFAAALTPRRARIEVVAFAAAFAAIAAAALLWHGDRADFDALPAVAVGLAAAVALVIAITAETLAGRCVGWAALTVWLPLAAATLGTADSVGASAAQIEFGLVAAAATMLVTAAGVPRRTRPDRVLAAILSHVLAGTTVAVMMLTDWIARLIEGADSSLLLPAAIGTYTLALVGVALMAPVKQWRYAVAALCTGTLAWWTLLTAYSVTTLEYYTGPPAALLFGLGVWRLTRRPEAGSWAALGPALAVGLGPSLLLALDSAEPVRRVALGAAALAVVVAAVARRWQAPLVLGSVTLLVLTINELALLWHLIPTWLPPALGGAVLILAGATLEQRRRDLDRLRRTVRAMR